MYCQCEGCTGKHEIDWKGRLIFYEKDFRDFCLEFPDHSLRSFCWETVACVPQNILGKDGYLTQRQVDIERLSLFTGISCEGNTKGRECYDLTNFRKIRSLSWVGPRVGKDFLAIRSCFDANAKHMKVLKLDLISWFDARSPCCPGNSPFFDRSLYNPFAQDILNVDMNSLDTTHSMSFPELRDLHLGQVSFRPQPGIFARAFNMSRLKRLVIWNCPGSQELLQYLACQAIQLITLELTGDRPDANDSSSIGNVLPSFLQSFTGLRNLFISLHSEEWEDILIAMETHLSTLNRVVLHSRHTDIDEENSYDELEEDGGLGFHPTFYNLFTNDGCEIIAIQNSPSFMRECLEVYAADVKCTLLHLRASEDNLKRVDKVQYVTRDDVNDFADWVFGPRGLPRLRVLAYGDFAFQESCRAENVLYCRNDRGEQGEDGPNYKVLTPSDKEHWHWAMDNMDFLSACPYKSIAQP